MTLPQVLPALSRSSPPAAWEASYLQYLEALLANDRPRCQVIIEQWLEAAPSLRSVYDDLVRRALYEVGDRWERGQVSVATEHWATAISESLLTLAYPRLFAAPRIGKSVVVATTADERHQLGARMVADLFEMRGWHAWFLGANTPQEDLLALIRERGPAAVALSLTVYFNLEALLRTAAAIRAEFPTLPILVGGQAFRWGGRERVEQIAGAHLIDSLDALESWMAEAARGAG